MMASAKPGHPNCQPLPHFCSNSPETAACPYSAPHHRLTFPLGNQMSNFQASSSSMNVPSTMEGWGQGSGELGETEVWSMRE